MDEEELKRFGEIVARFRKLSQEHRMAVEKGEFIRMIWAGILPEVEELIAWLVDAYGEPPLPQNEEPKKKERKPLKAGQRRLARVAANKGTDADAQEDL